MKFSEKLKKAMQELEITQKQLVGMTGIGKSSISMYLNSKTVPTESRQRDIALSLGLDPDYFTDDAVPTAAPVVMHGADVGIKKMMVADAAKLLGMNHNTVRKGLQQGVFPWGYAVRTSEHRWSYFINAQRFAEIEGVSM